MSARVTVILITVLDALASPKRSWNVLIIEHSPQRKLGIEQVYVVEQVYGSML